MNSIEPFTDEQIVMLASDALFDVMQASISTGYISLDDVHLAIGRAIEQAHGIGVKQ